MFNARDWYWSVGDDAARVFSSRRNTYVDAANDADYAAWAKIHGPYPSQVESESDIWFYLQEFMPAWLWNGTTMAQPSATTYSKHQLAGYAAEARGRKEQGGMTLATGMPILTDERAQVRILGLRLVAHDNAPLTTKWLAPDGKFYDLTAAQVIAMSDELQAHINDCFVIAADVQAQIAAGAITTREQVDSAFA
jgi:hypothetical protein